MTPEQVITSFCDQTPQPEIGNSVVLCYTNALTGKYNDAIRCRYFPGISQVVSGDILQVVRNPHINHDRDIEFYNGDFVKVLSVSDQIETLSASSLDRCFQHSTKTDSFSRFPGRRTAAGKQPLNTMQNYRYPSTVTRAKPHSSSECSALYYQFQDTPSN